MNVVSNAPHLVMYLFCLLLLLLFRKKSPLTTKSERTPFRPILYSANVIIRNVKTVKITKLNCLITPISCYQSYSRSRLLNLVFIGSSILNPETHRYAES